MFIRKKGEKTAHHIDCNVTNANMENLVKLDKKVRSNLHSLMYSTRKLKRIIDIKECSIIIPVVKNKKYYRRKEEFF